jgi:molybdate transport system permease protein
VVRPLICLTHAAWLSLEVAALMGILYPVFGFGCAYILSRPGFPFRRVLEALITLPLVFPPVAIGFFLLMLLGRGNVIGATLYRQLGFELVFSVWGVLLAAFISGLPLVVKPILSAIESGTEDLLEASYTLGRGRWVSIFRVLIPSIRRSIIAGVTLGVGRSLGEVGITLMLGGNIIGRTETLSLAIYNSVLDGDFPRATKISILLGAASLVIFIISRSMGE